METRQTQSYSNESGSSRPKIRLLLHAVDGLVPYLTPQLLQTCFPPSDRLWVGVAVKDTCTVPTFPTDHDPMKSKPRGYHFSSDSDIIDPWMKPYTRVTVPTFDLWADAQTRQHATSPAAIVVANDKHVMLWTGNGRHPIGPAEYYGSAQGLDSQYTVPLFDVGNDTKKRRVASLRRTREWSEDYRERLAKDTKGTLYPITLVDQQETYLKASVAQQRNHILTIAGDAPQEKTGFALIGWSYLPPQLQAACLQLVQPPTSAGMVAVLTTNSLAQILRAAAHGVTLIGSNLPQQWALQKRALLCHSWRNRDKKKDATVVVEPPAKRVKTENSTDATCTDSGTALQLQKPQQQQEQELDLNGCLDLNPPGNVPDHPWYRDKRPLLPGCTCHTCRIHTRAYVYHLVCAKEMLAEILLFIHNLHHLLQILERVEDEGCCIPENREALLAFISQNP